MITADEIDAAMTNRGGWTRDTLASWGVPWPPPKGWRRNLIANGAFRPEQLRSPKTTKAAPVISAKESDAVTFLIRKRGTKQRAHLWTGRDTFCRMWSTGGMGRDRSSYLVCDSPQGHEICNMCAIRGAAFMTAEGRSRFPERHSEVAIP